MIIFFSILLSIGVFIYKPKYFIYLLLSYHFLVPIYFIYFLPVPDYENARNGGYHSGDFGGVSLGAISVILSAIFLVISLFYKRKKLISYFKKKPPGLKYLALYSISILVVCYMQVAFLNADLAIIIKKSLKYLYFPILVFLIVMYYDTTRTKIYKFLFIWWLIIFIIFFIRSFVPHIINYGIFNYTNRLRDYMDNGWNGAAALLAMWFFYAKLKLGTYKINNTVFIIIGFITLFAIFLTYTRAVFIALAICYLLFVFFSKNKVFPILLIVVSLLVLNVDSAILSVLFRGKSNILTSTSYRDNNNFAGRINDLWLPSIYYLQDNVPNLFFGTTYRNFNEFINDIENINIANHNTFIDHLVNWGLIVTFFWFMFWFSLLKGVFLKIAKSSDYHDKRDVRLIFFSLVIYFISSNSMNITSYYIMNILAILIFEVYNKTFNLTN